MFVLNKDYYFQNPKKKRVMDSSESEAANNDSDSDFTG